MASYILLALPLLVQATNLATVSPCPDCPAEVSHAPVTVTKQFQVISTCSASTTSVSSTLYRYYPCEPSTWLSTVIPTISNGKWGNTTVTQPDQKVTFSALSSVETITSIKTALPTLHRRYQPPRLGFRAVNASASALPGSNSTGGAALPIGGTSTGAAALPGVITSPTVVTETQFRTHEVYNCAPFGQMGPIALPGTFGGSPICTGAGPDERGALTQTVEVTSCLDHACAVTSQTWIHEPVATVTHGTTTTITVTRTVGVDAQATGCSAFRLKAVRDNTKFHHGAQGYLSFPGAEGVLDGKKEAGSFSLDNNGVLTTDGKHVCAARSGPLAKTQRACRGSWTLNPDGSISYTARNDIAFCFAKDKTVFSRNANRSGCKPVKFVAECIAPKQSLPAGVQPLPAAVQPLPAAVQPLPEQTGGAAPAPGSNGSTGPTYGGGAAPAPGNNGPTGPTGPTYGGGAPAPGGNGPTYGGGAPAPGNPPSYGPPGGGAPAPGNPPSYGPPGGVPAPGASTTCTESLGAQPTAPVYGSGGPGPVAPSYGGGSIPVYGTGSPLPLPTTTSCPSSSLTDMPTGPTRTTTATDMPTGPTRTTSKSTSLTDKPTGPTRTTTTTDMSADPSAADPTVMPSPLRFEALGSRLMARGDEDPLDEGDVGQKARRHYYRRARNAGRAARWI